MSTKELVELDAAVLIAKYGLPAVLEAISATRRISVDEVHERMERIADSRARRQPKRVKLPDEVIEDLNAPYERKKQLKAVAALYQSRRLFPNLRDVTGFLRRHGVDKKKFKSRNEAFRALAIVLAALDERQIRATIDEADRSDSEDFTLLANRLMGATE